MKRNHNGSLLFLINRLTRNQNTAVNDINLGGVFMFLFKTILTTFGCWALLKIIKIAGAWFKYWVDGLDPETMHERRKYRQWLDDD